MNQEKKTEYWGEISLEQMHSFNNLCEEIGWRNASSRVLHKDMQETLSSEQRADWKYLTDINDKTIALDIGCGLGALSLSLSKTCAEVYALEPVWERIRFVHIRVKQDNIQNIRPVHASASHIPFPDNFFDLVVLNGVLEWVAYGQDDSRPDVIQEKVLQEAARVLKPDGVIYIGIENRFAFLNFLGVKDAHTGLPFINLMPRALADLYHQAVKKKKFSTYLYSCAGYRNLLNQAGFKKISFFMPLPSYRNFRYIFPVDHMDTTLKFWAYQLFYSKELFCGMRIKIFLGILKFILNTPLKYLLKYFTLDYSIIASKGPLPSGVFQSVASQDRAFQEETAMDKDKVALLYYKGFRKKLLFYFRDRAVRPSYVLKIAEGPVAEERLKSVSHLLRELSRLEPQIAQALPRNSFDGYIHKEYGLLQSVSEGEILIKYLLKYKDHPGKRDALLSQVAGYLATLNSKSFVSRQVDYKTELKKIIYENLESFTKDVSLTQEEYQRLSEYIEAATSSVKRVRLPYVVQHKDLQPENILYRDDHKFTIIDWEYGLKEGLPLIDLLNFLFTSIVYMSHHKERKKQRSFRPFFSVSSFTEMAGREIFETCFYQKNAHSDLIRKHVDLYCRALDIDQELRRILFLIFIFQELDYKKDFISVYLEKGYPINL